MIKIFLPIDYADQIYIFFFYFFILDIEIIYRLNSINHHAYFSMFHVKHFYELFILCAFIELFWLLLQILSFYIAVFFQSFIRLCNTSFCSLFLSLLDHLYLPIIAYWIILIIATNHLFLFNKNLFFCFLLCILLITIYSLHNLSNSFYHDKYDFFSN